MLTRGNAEICHPGAFSASLSGKLQDTLGRGGGTGDAGEGSRPFGTLPSTGCHYQRSPVPRNVLPAPVGARAATRQRRRGLAVQRGAPDDGVRHSEVGGVNPPSRKASRMPNEAWPASQVTVSSTHSKAWAPGTAPLEPQESPRGQGTRGCLRGQGTCLQAGLRTGPFGDSFSPPFSVSDFFFS